MGETTAIGWTDHTFNPWWGCTKIEGPNGTGSACDNCYAAAGAKRYGHDIWGKDAPRRFFGDKHWAEPLKWEKAAAAGVPGPTTGRADHLVFCASYADVFEARDDLDEHRARLWELIAATPHLTWLLLTKRPEQVPFRVPEGWMFLGEWPSNVWLGTTVEDQARADLRIPRLARIPAPVRFLSCEPLLGAIDLGMGIDHRGHARDHITTDVYPQCLDCSTDDHVVDWTYPDGPGIGWVIVGGESGPGHRLLDLDMTRSLRDQCAAAQVPFFFKQVGGQFPTSGGDELDGERHKQFPAGVNR